MRDSFIFYRSFQDAIEECPAVDQLAIYRAIADYALNRTEPDLAGIGKVCWVLIKPQLEANWRRFENGCKGAEYGEKGGAPKGNNNALKQNNPKTTPIQPQNNPTAIEKTTTNVNDNVFNNNGNANVKYNGKDVETAVSTKRETKRFTKPSIQEVKKFIQDNSFSVDPDAFYDYYEANGWMAGKNHMKDWKATIRNWNRKEWNKPQQNQKFSFEQADENSTNGFRDTL